MTAQLVSCETLKKSGKISLISSLAILPYLQNFFQTFTQAFPHIEIHIWVDEVRHTENTATWPYLKKYALYDWLAECPFVVRLYKQTYSPALFQQLIVEAQQQDYPLAVSLSTLRPPIYAALARQISPLGFFRGWHEEARWYSGLQPAPRLSRTGCCA